MCQLSSKLHQICGLNYTGRRRLSSIVIANYPSHQTPSEFTFPIFVYITFTFIRSLRMNSDNVIVYRTEVL